MKTLHKRWAIVVGATAVLALSLVLAVGKTSRQSPGPQSADNKPAADVVPDTVATWQPTSVVVTLTPGESETRGVTARVSSILSTFPLVAELDPKLDPYVSLHPAASQGASKTFRLVFDVAENVDFQTIEGAVVLRSGNTAFGPPLTIVLNVWPKASNEQFSLAYPPDVFASLNQDSALLRLPGSEDGDEVPSLVFTVDPNPQNLTLEEYYDGEPGRNLMGQSEGPVSVTVGGQVGWRFDPFITFAGETVTIVPLHERFLAIIDDGNSFESAGVLETILNSVAF